jgi:hypothetical protein
VIIDLECVCVYTVSGYCCASEVGVVPPEGEMTGTTLAETRWKAIVDYFQRNHEDLKTNNAHYHEEVELLVRGLQKYGCLSTHRP